MGQSSKIDVTEYWSNPPPNPTENLIRWIGKIQSGWRPNRRIRRLGHQRSAEFFGVYLWEYVEVLCPILCKVE